MPLLYRELGPGGKSELRSGEESEPLAARVALGRTMELVQVWLLPIDSLLQRGTLQPLKKRQENDVKTN